MATSRSPEVWVSGPRDYRNMMGIGVGVQPVTDEVCAQRATNAELNATMSSLAMPVAVDASVFTRAACFNLVGECVSGKMRSV